MTGDPPTPRSAFEMFGHAQQEAVLADALDNGRLHHAWLITGPKGVGKATLAYRLARRALGAERSGPRPLDVSPTSPIARRVESQAHPDLFVLERGLNERGRLRSEISVDEARQLGAFFSLTSSDLGRRVAIVDSADDLNRQAANAILKTLEEPPRNTILLLLSHSPGALLPTIRSRCRTLVLRPLDAGEMAEFLGPGHEEIIALADGRPGYARTLASDGPYQLAGQVREALNEGSMNKLVGLAAVGSAAGVGFEFVVEALLRCISRGVACHIKGGGGADNAFLDRGGPAHWARLYGALDQIRLQTADLDLDDRSAWLRISRTLAGAF